MTPVRIRRYACSLWNMQLTGFRNGLRLLRLLIATVFLNRERSLATDTHNSKRSSVIRRKLTRGAVWKARMDDQSAVFGMAQVFPSARFYKAMLHRSTDRAHILETGTESFRFRRTIASRQKNARWGPGGRRSFGVGPNVVIKVVPNEIPKCVRRCQQVSSQSR